MKTVFWVLLAVNLVFFAVMEWGGVLTVDTRNQQDMDELHPQRIKLLPVAATSAPQAASAALAAPAPAPAPAPASAPVAASAVQAASAPQAAKVAPAAPAAKAEPPAAPHVCMEWGDFTGDELAKVGKALAGLGAEHVARHAVEHQEGYWVYIPPLGNEAAVAARVAQLKAGGVSDYFVVKDAGKWQHAVSLGVFKSRAMAQTQLNQLKAEKGVNDATLGEYMSRAEYARFALKNLDAAAAQKLKTLARQHAGGELKAVACAKPAAKRAQ